MSNQQYVPEYVYFSRLLTLDGPTLLDLLVSNPNLLNVAGYQKSRVRPANFVISPLLIHLLLMVVRLEAGFDTAEEIRQALSHTAVDRAELRRTAKALIHLLKDEDIYYFDPVSKIYVHNSHTINRNFKIQSEGAFYIHVERVNFKAPNRARATINRWVRNRTLTTVHNIVPFGFITSSCKVAMISSASYKLLWNVEMDRDETTTNNFAIRPDHIVKVEFMHTLSQFKYHESEDLKAKFLQLDFVAEQGSLVIVLPNEHCGLAYLEDNFETVLSLPEDMFVREEMRVEVPKFVIATTLDWKPILREAGVNILFQRGAAEISGMAGEAGDLYVNNVIQKIIIRVDEVGIEGTTIYMPQLKPQPKPHATSKTAKDFIANRPFLFYVKIRGVIVFVGRLMNPDKSDEVY